MAEVEVLTAWPKDAMLVGGEGAWLNLRRPLSVLCFQHRLGRFGSDLYVMKGRWGAIEMKR